MKQEACYKLAALDMDGTLLNSRKKVSTKNRQAIQEAVSRGKTIVYATGRAVCEMEEYFEQLPEIRYAIFASGAGLYDIQEQRAFGLRPLPPEVAAVILEEAKARDIMPQIVLADCDAVQQDQLDQLEKYWMGVYRPMYERAMTRVVDIQAFGAKHLDEILKINLYHTNPEDRVLTLQELSGTQIEKVFSERTSLECSAKGVNKGSGLEALCSELGIEPAACIAVGDAENDLPMMRVAGLGVAMGNAHQRVRKAADRIVAGNDENGCAEAIRLLFS